MIDYGKLTATVVVLASLCMSHGAHAQTNRSVVLQYSQRQRQAKVLTERLLSQRIERQLQQMRDNGLTDIPLYEELSSMRERVGEIAEGNMSRVQEL